LIELDLRIFTAVTFCCY